MFGSKGGGPTGSGIFTGPCPGNLGPAPGKTGSSCIGGGITGAGGVGAAGCCTASKVSGSLNPLSICCDQSESCMDNLPSLLIS